MALALVAATPAAAAEAPDAALGPAMVDAFSRYCIGGGDRGRTYAAAMEGGWRLMGSPLAYVTPNALRVLGKPLGEHHVMLFPDGLRALDDYLAGPRSCAVSYDVSLDPDDPPDEGGDDPDLAGPLTALLGHAPALDNEALRLWVWQDGPQGRRFLQVTREPALVGADPALPVHSVSYDRTRGRPLLIYATLPPASEKAAKADFDPVMPWPVTEVWAAKPSLKQSEAFAPKGLSETGMAGLRCRVGAAGVLNDCQVDWESAPGLGAAALAAAPLTRLNPRLPSGESTQGLSAAVMILFDPQTGAAVPWLQLLTRQPTQRLPMPGGAEGQ